MEHDTPSASWHPAFMPNSHAEKLASVSHADQSSQPLPPPPTTEFARLQDDEVTPTNETAHDTTRTEATNHATFLDQFDDEDPEAAAWDLSAPDTQDGPAPHDEPTSDPYTAAAEEPVTIDEPVAADALAVPVELEETEETAPAVSSKAGKHSSTMSFARTAQEVNWNDDEDTEWNLQRTETDPFRFMPPNDRTNSFPVVPTIPSARQETPEQILEEPLELPPAPTQAQNILQELEQEEDDAESAAQSFPTAFDAEDTAEHGHDDDASFFQQYVGGDTLGSAEEASDARFEEGLPLIPQGEPEGETQNSHEPTSQGFDAAFADEAGDDFFSQLQSGPTVDSNSPSMPHSLQRKDTSMFVGSSTKPLSTETTFEPETSTVEEAEEYEPLADSIEETVNGESTGSTADASNAGQPEPRDLDAKWAEAFAGDDDDDFLLEDTETQSKDLDPADFLGSDDEGLLEDTPIETPTLPSPTGLAQPALPSLNGQYLPTNPQQQSQPGASSSAAPSQFHQAQHPSYAPAATAPSAALGYGAPPARPNVPKVASFVDKARGGYSSPYDLDMSMVKAPKKRPSTQHLSGVHQTPAPPVAPPKPASSYSQPPPPAGVSLPSPSRPTSSHSAQVPQPGQKPAPPLRSKQSFFEDLPMSTKSRPVSRHSAQSSQHGSFGVSHGPPQASPTGPSQGPPFTSAPAQTSMPTVPVPPATPQGPPGVASLVTPERATPYGQLPSSAPPRPTAPPNSRYSPAPAQASGPSPGSAGQSRYSPAPPNARSNSGGYSAVPPPVLAHQPRTSSPLAHFEVSRERPPAKLPSPVSSDPMPMARSASSQYDARSNRVASLPPTQEVDEEAVPSPLLSPPTISRNMATMPPADSRYSPQKARHTPPPGAPIASSILSPTSRAVSSYAPSSATPNHVNFAPPPRSQTQSPGSQYGQRAAAKPADPIARPSSVQNASSPRAVSHPQTSPTTVRTRGMSQSLTLVPPTDGRENDPLQRWRGAPLISWGVGGTIVTSFPKDVPRYGASSAIPMIIRSPGEVSVKHVKDIQPLEDRLAKFPGPLKGKSKKKETVAWLTTGIEALEGILPNLTFQQQLSHEDKRAIERVLLWKILRVFIESDGVLEGTPAVDQAVRQVLSPEISGSIEPASAISAGPDSYGAPSAVAGLRSDAVDSSAVEGIRNHLLAGDREKAVWAAVDKRLWGHALLIANTVPGELYKQVSQEFIKAEVNPSGESNESLAALYSVLSGNFEESVDALVPVHARAGLQLMSTSSSMGQSKDELAGLDKWRETLGLILSNRSVGDIRALSSLGNLLAGYGRAEAAHICFLFARQHAVFGGLDDPNAQFVLVGADHRRQADQFGKEIEALLLSEVFEYGLSLSGGSNVPQSCPHLAAYKLQHAMTLAQYGFRDKALQYCDTILTAIQSQTKRSPYYHPTLESAVDDFMKRLKLAPKEESSSWISKPKMDSVSSTMWNRFNKFVAGDENDLAREGAQGEGGESGPFARIASGTPTISRSPSVSGFEMYGSNLPAPAGPPASRGGSRYAPAGGQPSTSPYDPSSSYNPAPRSSMERSSGEMQRSSYELTRPTLEPSPMYGGSFASESNNSVPTFGYQPIPAAAPQSSPYAPATQGSAPIPIPSQPLDNSYNSYQPYAPHEPAQTYGAPPVDTKPEVPVAEGLNGGHSGYQPVSDGGYQPTSNGGYQPVSDGGYQPPSYGGYEPPTINSFEAPASQPEEAATSGGYEAPSYQPYSFEPPSYQPEADDGDSGSDKPKKSKKSYMDDDDDMPAMKNNQDQSKADKDRENQELFRKAAEEDAKRAEAAKAQKKGWFSGGWFAGGGGGGGAKREPSPGELPNKPVRANLGEASSFVYDPDLKRWVNKKGGGDDMPAKTATPPPPRAASRNGNGTPPPPLGRGPTSAPPGGLGVPPPGPPMSRSASNLSLPPSHSEGLNALGGPPMMRSASNMSNAGGPPSAPPSRPATSLGNASSIDDLIGAAGPRKAGAKKARKSGRYVDVMAK